MRLSEATVKRMNKAIEEDNTMVATLADIRDGKSSGWPLSRWEALGLTKGDLQRLERAGFAFQARTRNIWLPGETTPDGKQVPEDSRAVGRGSRALYWLIAKEND